MRRAIAALALLALAPVPALAQQAHSCEPADLAALDGWRGVWIAEGFESDISGRLPGGQRDVLPFSALMPRVTIAAGPRWKP